MFNAKTQVAVPRKNRVGDLTNPQRACMAAFVSDPEKLFYQAVPVPALAAKFQLVTINRLMASKILIRRTNRISGQDEYILTGHGKILHAATDYFRRLGQLRSGGK